MKGVDDKERMKLVLVTRNQLLHDNQIIRRLTSIENLEVKTSNQAKLQLHHRACLVLAAATVSVVLVRNVKVFDLRAPLKWTK